MNVNAARDSKGPSGCQLLHWLKNVSKPWIPFEMRISHSTCVSDRFTEITPPHIHTIQGCIIIFMLSWTIVQCSFICRTPPAAILRYRSAHARWHCLSDTDSHAVFPSFYYSLNNELHLSPACPSKTQRSYGRLTRTRQAYNLYWLSSRIWKMSSWTYPIPCSAFLSWELIIWLPPAYFCPCSWKPEAAIFTCNTCHHIIISYFSTSYPPFLLTFLMI